MFPTVCLLYPVTDEYLAVKRAKKLCRTWRCLRPAVPGRSRCWTCNCRLHRVRHPEHYVFVGLKASARKRKIKFELTFEEFTTFITGTGYMEKRGKEPHSMTIDRRYTNQPYRLDNLRFLTHADNSSHKFEETTADDDAPPW